MKRERPLALEFALIAVVALSVIGVAAALQARATPDDSTTRVGSQPSETQPLITATDVVPNSSPTIIVSTVVPGRPIDVPALKQKDITLIAVDAPPVIPVEQVLRAIADIGVPWALGGQWNGKDVTITPYYGLATFGRPGLNGVWEGDRNIPLPNGEVLDHSENRPMWIVDYGNTEFLAGGCPDCPEPPKYNHSVYAVDAATGQVWTIWGYVGDDNAVSSP